MLSKDDEDDLRRWAQNWVEGIGLVQGRQVLTLLAELNDLRKRVDMQSNLLELLQRPEQAVAGDAT